MQTFIFCCAFFFAIGVSAQTIAEGTESETFQQQLTAYQNWLTESGLGNFIGLESRYCSKESALTHLALYFKNNNPSLIEPTWNRLKQHFEKVNQDKIERILHHKLCLFFEVSDQEANIHIHWRYDLSNASPLEVDIYYDAMKNEVVLEEQKKTLLGASAQLDQAELLAFNRLEVAKTTPLVFTFTRNQLSRILNASPPNPTMDKRLLFQKIYGFLLNLHPKKPSQYGRIPEIFLRDSIKELRLDAKNLEKVVLRDESPGFWCRLLRLDQLPGRTCIPREMLTYRVVFDERALIDGRITLRVYLDFKMTSGLTTGDAAYRAYHEEKKKKFDEYCERFKMAMHHFLLNG